MFLFAFYWYFNRVMIIYYYCYYSLFYIFAELWGSFVLSLAFWGFANDTTKVSESKRFYALFGLGANLALYAAGFVTPLVANIKPGPEFSGDAFQLPINILMGLAAFSSVAIILIYRWINRNVLTDPRFFDQSEQGRVKKEKPKMSLKDSFKFLIRSRYLLCIALIVLGYNASIVLIESTWKDHAKQLFPTAPEFSSFMGIYQQALAVTTIVMLLFVSNNVIKRFGWAVAAYLTPVVLLITGLGFFTFIIFKEPLTPMLMTLSLSPLFVAVIFGTVQNVLSKAAKYSLFDPTKEMAYIPLDQESKVKGKAAIDTVGARLGKAGGSGIQMGLILVFGSLGAITPQIGVILFVVIAMWIWAIKKLDDIEFKKLEGRK